MSILRLWWIKDKEHSNDTPWSSGKLEYVKAKATQESSHGHALPSDTGCKCAQMHPHQTSIIRLNILNSSLDASMPYIMWIVTLYQYLLSQLLCNTQLSTLHKKPVSKRKHKKPINNLLGQMVKDILKISYDPTYCWCISSSPWWKTTDIAATCGWRDRVSATTFFFPIT